MSALSGTRTEANLKAAFAGESEARNKYTYYASKAKKEGYEQIAGIFTETADNEKEHAKIWFKLLHGGDIPSTEANLRDAVAGEHYEWTEMYRQFAEEAKAEGFLQIADLFTEIGEIEEEHEKRFKRLLDSLLNHRVFSRDGETFWQCRNCGYVHVGKEAPDTCPACAHPQAYFQLRCENF